MHKKALVLTKKPSEKNKENCCSRFPRFPKENPTNSKKNNGGKILNYFHSLFCINFLTHYIQITDWNDPTKKTVTQFAKFIIKFKLKNQYKIQSKFSALKQAKLKKKTRKTFEKFH